VDASSDGLSRRERWALAQGVTPLARLEPDPLDCGVRAWTGHEGRIWWGRLWVARTRVLRLWIGGSVDRWIGDARARARAFYARPRATPRRPVRVRCASGRRPVDVRFPLFFRRWPVARRPLGVRCMSGRRPSDVRRTVRIGPSVRVAHQGAHRVLCPSPPLCQGGPPGDSGDRSDSHLSVKVS
jgi:hypothetical protein